MRDSVSAVVRDLAAGLAAIVAVVGAAVVFQFVGSDLRILFAIDGLAFFLAGVARPGRAGSPAWRQGLIVSAPGLLGDVALIVNNGGHRLEIPITITLTSIACTILGVSTRRAWSGARGRPLGLTALFVTVLASWVAVGLPRLLTSLSFRWGARTAPTLHFTSLDGQVVHVPDLQGRVVVLAFWATWCLPCRWELPEIQRVYRRFAADPRVAVWAVDVDWGHETPARARRFLDRMGVAIPAAFDSGFSARAFGVGGLPSIALVDGRGRLRMTHSGYDRSEDLARGLSAAIERVLREPPETEEP